MLTRPQVKSDDLASKDSQARGWNDFFDSIGHESRFGPAPTMSRLPPIADVETSVRRGRDGPLPDSRTAKLALFDYLVGMGECGLLGQPRFPKTLYQELRV